MGADSKRDRGRVVRAGESYVGAQGLTYTPGVSAETVASDALWLGSVPVPPGGRTKAHIHEHRTFCVSPAPCSIQLTECVFVLQQRTCSSLRQTTPP